MNFPWPYSKLYYSIVIQYKTVNMTFNNIFLFFSSGFAIVGNIQCTCIQIYFLLENKGNAPVISLHTYQYTSLCIIIPSPTKLRRDISLPSVFPSFRNILMNTLESTSFNGFWPNLWALIKRSNAYLMHATIYLLQGTKYLHLSSNRFKKDVNI